MAVVFASTIRSPNALISLRLGNTWVSADLTTREDEMTTVEEVVVEDAEMTDPGMIETTGTIAVTITGIEIIAVVAMTGTIAAETIGTTGTVVRLLRVVVVVAVVVGIQGTRLGEGVSLLEAPHRAPLVLQQQGTQIRRMRLAGEIARWRSRSRQGEEDGEE